MNKLYIIVPLVLMVGFGFIYKDFSAKDELKKIEAAATLKAEAEAEPARKREAERISKEDADRRTAEREAEEAARLAKRRAEREAASQKIADDTNAFNTEANKLAAEAADLELKLRDIRNQRDAVAAEAFELTKQVEMPRIDKRTAELEIQRMTAMISKRAEESSMTKLPDLAPPAPAR